MNVGGSTDTTVTAHKDSTTITLNGSPLTTLSAGQTHRFTSSQFDLIDADKPIFTAGRRGTAGIAGDSANIAWNPTEWAGREFSFNAIRNSPQVLTVYAIEDAIIEVKQGSTILDSATVTKGNGTTLSWVPFGSYQITSTGNILAYHISINGSSLHDPKPLIPGFTQIIGFPSNSMRLTTNSDNTNYSAIHSNSALASGSINRSSETNIGPEGGTSALYQGDSLLISADKKISGASFADSNGLAAGAFISTNLMKTNYIIPVNSDYIAFASKLPGTITVRNPAGTIVQTLTLTRSGANTSAPYRVRTTSILAGYRFESTVPIGAWYHPDTDIGASNDDETLLYGTNE